MNSQQASTHIHIKRVHHRRKHHESSSFGDKVTSFFSSAWHAITSVPKYIVDKISHTYNHVISAAEHVAIGAEKTVGGAVKNVSRDAGQTLSNVSGNLQLPLMVGAGVIGLYLVMNK